MDPLSHRGPAVVLLLLTAIILEVLRRILALAIAAGILLAFAFLSHAWPFSG
jgi:hypothetical protein